MPEMLELENYMGRLPLREKGIVVSPELWQRVKTIVSRALELPPDQWPSYIQETCEGDRGLRDEVHSLLEVSWAIGDFIEKPAYELLRRELTLH